MWLVFGIVAVLVAGHANDLLTQREHWPFSMYPMYSIAQTDYEMKLMKLAGVTDENPPREMIVDGGGRWMRGTLGRFATGPTKDLKKLRKGFQQYLQKYDQRAAAGEPGLLPLTGLRLYEYKWDLRSESVQKFASQGLPLEKMPAERTLLGSYDRNPSTAPTTAATTEAANAR
ncbi:MAG TPA: hypothetical protein VL282_10060 [Tepidisphaeraceae bacterium]|nr:hypothetical protein [Tepidisphaeraceae bacterium]